MRDWFRRWWPLLKVLLFVVVLAGVGWQFAKILRSEELAQTDRTRSPGQILWDEARRARAAELAAGAALYLAGLGFSAFFWIWLVRSTGERLPAVPGVRGYFISHLGKYVPGKGWALVLRTTAASEAGVRPGVAVLTAVYEVLTTMASGALVAAALLAWQGGGDSGTVWRVLGLLVLAGVPILPGVFNRVVERLAARVVKDGPPPPRLGTRALLVGLATTAWGWFLLGASLEVVLRSLDLVQGPWSVSGWLRSTAFVAVSNVAGFIASTPGGLGVREFLLQQFLAPELGARAVVVVLLLRLLWTVAEVVLVAILWWLPRGPSPQPSPQR